MFDSPESLITGLQGLTGIIFLVGLLSLTLTIFYFRRSRNKAYWRQRRRAGNRGAQYGLVSLVLLGLSGALCMVTVAVMFVEDESIEANGAPLVANPTASPSPTPSDIPPTDSVRQPTAATTAENPTEAPSTTPPPPTATPPPLPADIRFEIVNLDDAISDTGAAIQPGESFATDTERIYVFFQYAGLAPGTRWQQVLERDGEPVQTYQSRWAYSTDTTQGYFFFGRGENGPDWAPGAYRVRFT
ncbi:MAG: hypothetical protein ACLFTK_06545, partial [Anaerolineales bacterium]